MPKLAVPGDLEVDDLVDLVSREWHIDGGNVARLPVGGDSWSFKSGSWFVNVRDARGQRHRWRQPRDVEPAFEAAIVLVEAAGLDFLLAPTRTLTGRPVARMGRFAVTVMPYVDGAVHYRPYERSELALTTAWMARLHAAPVAVPARCLPSEGFLVECNAVLRAALDRAIGADVGPYSVRLRDLIRRHRETVLASLNEHLELAQRLRAEDLEFVITHGEPFPGNVFHSADGERCWLIDLSELRFAPKERDLGLLQTLATAGNVDQGVVEETYGAAIDQDAATFYQQRWGLEEITIGVDRLSRPHTGTSEDDDAWNELTTHYLAAD